MSDLQVHICRFCLCKCENPINMLTEGDFIEKSSDVFYKLNLEVRFFSTQILLRLNKKFLLKISQENGLPVIVCIFCYNTIVQFHAYFVCVAENQEKLTSELEELLQEEVTRDEIKVEDDEEWHVLEEDIVETSPGDIGNYIEIHAGEESDVDLTETTKNESFTTKRSKRFIISDEMIKKYKEGASLEPSLKEKLAKKYNKLFICHFCEFYTFSKPRIVSHVLECKDTWCLPPKIRASYRTIPDKEMLTIPCPLCPSDALKMKNDRILQLHLTEHADFDRIDRDRLKRGCPPLIPCPRCERRLRTEIEFHSHLKKHANDELFTCELCGRTTLKSNLRSHLRNHFKKIICEFCSKVFKNPSGLQKHIKAKHSGPEFFVCDRCNMKIRREQKFKEHLSVCRGPGTVWPCIHCGETFESNSHRHYHVKKFHIGYKCKMCGVEVKSVTQLKHHYKSEAHKQRSQEKRAEIAKSKLTKGNENSAVLKRR